MFSARRNIALFILCIIVGVAGIVIVNNVCLYTPDSARYLAWAKSLASFDGYKDNTLPSPLRYVIHAPLYALLLAPVAFFFPYSVLAAKLLTLCFGVMLIVLFYTWMNKHTNSNTAFVFTSFLAISPMFLIYSTEVLSDIPFAACTLCSILLFERLVSASEFKPWLLLSISISITAGILLREVGFSLLFSVVTFLVIRKEWKQAVLIALIPLAMYVIWYVRNELIVAPFDLPEITNAKLFTHRFFSASQDSLLTEFFARISNNAFVYGKGIGKLMIMPFYWFMHYDVVFLTQAPLLHVYSALDILVYPFVFFSIIVTLYGIVLDYRQSTSALFLLLLLFFYLAIVLVYPVNDIRFMMPLLLLMLYYIGIIFARFIKAIPQRDNPSLLLRISPILIIVIAVVPNLIWDAQFLRNNYAYKQSPLTFFESLQGLQRYPSHFTKPFDLAGKWIASNTKDSTVIMSQWKDLVCWVEGRKVLMANSTVQLDDFDNFIRDYGVKYLVVVEQKNGVREFEFQMLQSRKFAFTQVQRFANISIIEAHSKDIPRANTDRSTLFRSGITLLGEGKNQEANHLLDTLYLRNENNMPVLLYSAIANEFNMKLHEANERFSRIRSMPQSLIFLDEAVVHQQIIQALLNVETIPAGSEKGESYFRIAAGYWNLGYRTQARMLNGLALQQDSTLFPAMIFGMYYALVEGDTMIAKNFLKYAKDAQKDSMLVMTWEKIFSHMDMLKKTRSSTEYAAHCMSISSLFSSLGIVESAIDNALLALRYDTNNLDALKQLAHLYQQKRRYASARNMLERAYKLEPQNIAIQKELQSVLLHF